MVLRGGGGDGERRRVGRVDAEASEAFVATLEQRIECERLEGLPKAQDRFFDPLRDHRRVVLGPALRFLKHFLNQTKR